MKGITLLYDDSRADEVSEKVVPLFKQHLRNTIAFTNGWKDQTTPDDYIVTYLADQQLKEFLPCAIAQEWLLSFLPHPVTPYARHGFGLSASLEDAVDTILKFEHPQKIDLFQVNGIPVFDTVVIGECLSVMYGSNEASEVLRLWGKIKSFFRLLRNVRLHQYTIEYKEKGAGEQQSINTAALGMLVVQHGKSSLLSRRILEDSYANDGMMHNLVMAPESGLGLLKFGFMSLFRSSKNPKLPPFAGYIKTNKIKVKSEQAIELSVDETLMSAKEVTLEVIHKKILLVPVSQLDTTTKETNKEVFKIQTLPKGELKEELLKGPIPLIPHATAEQFKELFTTLRENARPTSSYLVLMFLSTFIATLGLFSNSSPVIIGAMILAPLMSPIISLSMGFLRQDSQLIRSSLKSIGLGLLLGYLCAMLITWLMPLSASNVQILTRTRPNLLDLGIAVGSGIAGAYAHAKKEIAKTLAGVAIAVALVPPLAVSGIGAGRLNWEVFSGALLLLSTNLAGIVLAAAITFLFLGFSPFRRAKKGIMISLFLVLGISAPLTYGFTRMVRETNITQQLDDQEINGIVIRDVSVRKMNPLQLSITIMTKDHDQINEVQLGKLKQEIENILGEKVELEINVGIKI